MKRASSITPDSNQSPSTPHSASMMEKNSSTPLHDRAFHFGTDKKGRNVSKKDPAVPPNGGYGWVCTICVALINAHTWGINSSYGVFLAHYLRTETFAGATHLQYAFVGGLSISLAMFISPVATLLTRKYGTRLTLLVGTVFETAGLIGASFATTIWQLFLSQGVAFGFGMGFLFVASVGIPVQWFTTKRSLANGISSSGSGFGGLLYSLAAGAMIKSIGLAWCFRVLGILAFGVNIVCILLIRDRNKIIMSRHKTLDVMLMKRPEFIILCGYGFFSMLGYIALVFSMADYARSIGLNNSQASESGGRRWGYFSDNVGRINMAGSATFLCGLLALVIWSFAKSYGLLIFYALVGGTVAGTFWATVSPVTVEVVGLQDLPSALNLEWLVTVLPCTFSEPMALELATSAGGYLSTSLFVGFMYIAAAACVLLLRGWKVGELDEIARLNSQLSDGTSTLDVDSGSTNNKARKKGRETILKNVWKWRKV
ncbi:putative MFS transporter [Boeremia exigua]|uniref:putative MFS transporter n=1 Tax=Boeremia exigua TaxID=749465 RepID=UPI001E8CF332|nr:putative MFS transporter [Boeremia exigua]KAH6638467.1 putative MFS transporter [Boeremia exigua]